LFKVSAIIPAAGSGSRFGEKKQFKNLNGEPLWAHTLKPFVQSSLIDEIIFVVEEGFIGIIRESKCFKQFVEEKEIKITKGGARRMDSVLNGIQVSKKMNDIVCIHDVARPFVSKSLINKTIEACKNFNGAISAIPTVDTVKNVENKIIKKTLSRSQTWMAQTPQTFRKNKLLKAFNDNVNVNVTDESTLMELSGFSIKIINGEDKNFKITKKIDWVLAKIIAKENKL
tara:strand:- start:1149 stop:1832 length:684 start_codon:yes stop_codon:yes gene_type:complete